MIEPELQHEIDQLSSRLEKIKLLLTKNEVLATLIKGDKGDRGMQGEIGLTGATGKQGEQGIQGEHGFQGIQGFRGEKGEQGIRGEQGIQGEKGLDGKDGSPDLPDEVVKKINESNEKISAKQIKDLPNYTDGRINDNSLRGETPTAISSTVFSIVNTPKGIALLFRNGAAQTNGVDYTQNGRIFTLVHPLETGEILWIIY